MFALKCAPKLLFKCFHKLAQVIHSPPPAVFLLHYVGSAPSSSGPAFAERICPFLARENFDSLKELLIRESPMFTFALNQKNPPKDLFSPPKCASRAAKRAHFGVQRQAAESSNAQAFCPFQATQALQAAVHSGCRSTPFSMPKTIIY